MLPGNGGPEVDSLWLQVLPSSCSSGLYPSHCLKQPLYVASLAPVFFPNGLSTLPLTFSTEQQVLLRCFCGGNEGRNGLSTLKSPLPLPPAAKGASRWYVHTHTSSLSDMQPESASHTVCLTVNRAGWVYLSGLDWYDFLKSDDETKHMLVTW